MSSPDTFVFCSAGDAFTMNCLEKRNNSLRKKEESRGGGDQMNAHESIQSKNKHKKEKFEQNYLLGEFSMGKIGR